MAIYLNVVRKVVRHLGGKAISQDKTLELLMMHYAARCKPPLSYADAEMVVKQVYSRK